MSQNNALDATKLFIGIDLGTTNSAIAVSTGKINGKLQTSILEVEREINLRRDRFTKERRSLLPSCVAYCELGNNIQTIVGDYAKELARTQPFAVACSIKSQMGQPFVNIPGWNPKFPDQAPEQVSSRILQKLLNGVRQRYFEDATDAVITVPANFDFARRQATLKAAELAGIKIYNENGILRDDILLTEPEAVIYDTVNQAQNGDITLAIDFNTERKVLVFDIGGGTLDITLHSIRRNLLHPESFDIKPIAINRFSNVAGDTFDLKLAEYMFENYLNSVKQEDTALAQRIVKEKNLNMLLLKHYAEELKVDFSERYQEQIELGKELPLSKELSYGGDMPSGISCEDYMERVDFEKVLSPLLGLKYSFEDYKKFNEIEDQNTIIYPILDVLHKAAEKLKTDELKIDAVLMNGGMSRLYLIKQRLEQFFGFPPSCVTDPDKSVARGAAVYHYYLRQNAELYRTQHQYFMEDQLNSEEKQKSFQKIPNNPFHIPDPLKGTDHFIRTLTNVQNIPLYLGLKGGNAIMIINSGQDLPFRSLRRSGFAIEAGQNRICFPIKIEGKINEEKSTIATGTIISKKTYPSEMPVDIQFTIGRDGILTLDAWIGDDEAGSTEISIGDTQLAEKNKNAAKKLLPPLGEVLNVTNELSALRQDILKSETMSGWNQTLVSQRIATSKKRIINSSNAQEFITPILKILKEDYYKVGMAINFFPIARKLSRFLQDNDKQQVVKCCFNKLDTILHGFPDRGKTIGANIEAINTIGALGTETDCMKLEKLCNESKYYSSLLYAFGLQGIKLDWIYQLYQKRQREQETLIAFIRYCKLNRSKISQDFLETIAYDLIRYVENTRLPDPYIGLAIVGMGLYCKPDPDREVDKLMNQKALAALSKITEQKQKNLTPLDYPISVAYQLISGNKLSEENEAFLLKLLEEK